MTSMTHIDSTVNPRATPATSRVVIAGIDTHKELHVAAVIDTGENIIATGSFSTTRAGYRALIRWVRTFGDVVRVGVEGTGSYGTGITRHLTDAGIEVLEVDRPDRSDRRRKGKDDDLDAISAARAALHNRRTSTPKSKDGAVESLRVLRVTRQTAIRERPAVAAHEHRLGTRRVARSGPQPNPHAADPDLRRVATGHQQRRRPGQRDQGSR